MLGLSEAKDKVPLIVSRCAAFLREYFEFKPNYTAMLRFLGSLLCLFLFAQMCISLPCEATVSQIEKDVCESLSNRYYPDDSKLLKARICSCCDRFATVDNPMVPLGVDEYVYCLSRCRISSSVLKQFFPEAVLDSYKAKERRLEDFCLSPGTRIFQDTTGYDCVDLCTNCWELFDSFLRSKKKVFNGPKEAVFNGNMCGDPPECLLNLNAAELALVSPNRILTHALVLQCDNHDGIVGWHSMFENSVETNVSNIQLMIEAGLQSEFLCVLCGPWTRIQLDKVKNAYRVRPDKVIEAFEWLKKNNVHYKDIVIPDPRQMRNVRILHHHTFETREHSESEIENEINVMVLLPDSREVGYTNGVFDSQEEFCRFLLENGSAHIQKTFFTKPTKQRPKEYLDDEFVKAFPLQFPFGTGGFPKEKKLSEFFKKAKEKQTFKDRIRHLLRSRPKTFHCAQFNLVSNGILMKNDVFQTVRLQCNLRYEQSKSMGAKFGTMTSYSLEESISKARNNICNPSDSDKFLNSISAVSESLPHSNEAADAAKQDYFSYLVSFGLPALMVTISPDDQRGLWIQVALHRNPTDFTLLDSIDQLDDSELIILYKKRCGDRLLYPGLCAEEYMAVVETFIRDVLKWDTKTSKSTGIGLFGRTVAFTAATEEQGRKTLHGHFLVWIEGWNKLLEEIMSRKGPPIQLRTACNHLKRFVEHCASAETFDECHKNGMLPEVKPFEHDGCRNQRQTDASRFTVNPVSARIFDEMRHNDTCYSHNGHIADCPNCKKEIRFEELMDHSLKCVSSSQLMRYDRSKRRLENHVFELQKDRLWYMNAPKERAKRIFYSNVLSNTHTVHHTKRCFKKSGRCYTDFPIEPCDRTRITFAETGSLWSDFDGKTRTKYLFEVTLKQKLEDCYTNTHNRLLTSAFLCNNNIITAMTGAAVIYLTCYSVKKTQKEERKAFEKVASVVVQCLRKQEEDPDPMNNFLIDQVGFRRLMLAVMVHTSSLVIAAPMAHYIAMNGSRHRYSHDRQHIPIRSLSRILKGEHVQMHLSLQKNSERTPFCSALNYIYRPTDKQFEPLSPWEFWTRFKVIEKSRLIKKQKCYQFSVHHPKHGNLVIVERSFPVIPKIDWTFFGDAKNLSYQITTKPENPSSADEDHCRKLLILFTSYRKESDLSVFNPGNNRRSYCQRFYQLYSEGRLSESTRYMQNIQNIRNSLDAGRINSKHLVDESTAEEDCDNESDDNLDVLQSEIASMFFSDRRTTQHRLSDNLRQEYSENDSMTGVKSTSGSSVTSILKEFDATTKTNKDQPTIPFRTKCNSDTLNTLIKSSFRMQDSINNDIKCTGSAESIIQYGMKNKLDLGQQYAFEVLCATVVSSFVDDCISSEEREHIRQELVVSRNLLADLAHEESRGDKPLRLFLTGPAGSGKSTILTALISYVQQFCNNIGCIFDKGVIRLTALTGAAATEIKGQTTHKECLLGSKTKITDQNIREWLNTRLLVVDEISFAGYTDFLMKLSKSLQTLTECNDHLYGRVPIVFIGDFLQLEPVASNDCIYKVEDSYFWELALNLMIELDGQWRFVNCPKLQHAFNIVRNEGFTDEVKRLLNTRVLSTELTITHDPNLKIATFKNKQKELYNNTIFMQHIKKHNSKDADDLIPKSSVIIKAGLAWKHNNKGFTEFEQDRFFEDTTEANTRQKKDTSKRVDPLLKLFSGCEVMVTENKDVSGGIANGTTATLESVVLKQNRKPHKVRYNGYWVLAVHAEDIDRLELRWSSDSLYQGKFSIRAQTFDCTSKVKITTEADMKKTVELALKITTFPITSNGATTGHKLQGKTVNYLFVGEYAPRNIKNWLYVVLSRVRKLENLFLVDPVPEDTEPLDPMMTRMMEKLRDSILLTKDMPTIESLRQQLL